MRCISVNHVTIVTAKMKEKGGLQIDLQAKIKVLDWRTF